MTVNANKNSIQICLPTYFVNMRQKQHIWWNKYMCMWFVSFFSSLRLSVNPILFSISAFFLYICVIQNCAFVLLSLALRSHLKFQIVCLTNDGKYLHARHTYTYKIINSLQQLLDVTITNFFFFSARNKINVVVPLDFVY